MGEVRRGYRIRMWGQEKLLDSLLAMELKKTLGQRIRELRKEKVLSLREFSERLGAFRVRSYPTWNWVVAIPVTNGWLRWPAH